MLRKDSVPKLKKSTKQYYENTKAIKMLKQTQHVLKLKQLKQQVANELVSAIQQAQQVAQAQLVAEAC